MAYLLLPSIQHCVGGSSQYNQARKGNKSHPFWEKEEKIPVFANNMYISVENLMEFTKKLLELVIIIRMQDIKSI